MIRDLTGWLGSVLRRTPRLASDYRTYDMRKMRGWGNNAFWWPREDAGKKACIFGPTPKVGDALVCDSESGEGLVFVIVSVDTPRDPGDQHFVEVVRWGRPADLPERIVADDPVSRAREDYIS